MNRMVVSPATLMEILETLAERTEEAKAWVKKHNEMFPIEVPKHLRPTLGPRDRCLGPAAPIQKDGVDDQAIVEVLWLVQEAMEAEKPARPATAKKPPAGGRR